MEATTFYPTQQTTRKPVVYLTRQQKAERMGFDGYALSVPLYARSTFLVHKPLMAGQTSSQVYRVDLSGKFSTCDCYDSRNNGGGCKHILFVEKCIRYAATLPSEKTRLLQAAVQNLLDRVEAQKSALAELSVGIQVNLAMLDGIGGGAN